MLKGHTETEVGLLPEDWEAKKLSDISDVRDGTHESPKYFRDGVKLITSKNIVTGRIDYSDVSFIASEDAVSINRRSRVDRGDILMSMIGTVGNCALVDCEPDFCIKNVALIKPRGISREYLVQLLSSAYYQRYIRDKIKGGIQEFVSLDVLRNLLVPFPVNTSEQSAIAAALSDADAVIASLEKLIAKKRDIKKGAMQLLLTGKKRLPGFTGEWGTNKIGDIFSVKVGKSLSRYISKDGSYIVVDMGSVSAEGKLLVTKTTGHAGDFLSSGDLVMPKDDIGGGNIIGKVAYIDADNRYVLGDHVYAMRCKQGNSRFFSYLVNSRTVNMSLRRKVAGSAQLGLSRKSVEEQEVCFPCIEEQAAIVQVLSDMEAELEALERKREKYRLVKQGMMHELLTGKKRLICEN